MEYDEAGNQKRLTDPDAGVTTYEYSADGILLKQTDAKGVETVNTYDELGNLSQVSIGGVAIKNTYKKSGYGKLLLSSKKMGAHMIQYTYDKFGRLTREHKNFRGTGVFDTKYEYDDRNRLVKITYPGDLEVNYQYDDYGHVMKMTADGKDVYQLASYDGLSTKTTFMTDISVTRTKDSNGYESEARITSYKLRFIKDPIIGPGPKEDPSIGIQSNSLSDHGRPVVGGDEREFFQEYQIGTLDRHDVSYDPLTDNLLARKRYGGSVESFGYDNLDRLTSVSTSTATTVTGTGTLTEVMGITYAPNGNILSKTGVGDYTYNSTAKPHAVMAVDNTDGLIPSNALSTSFNILGLVSNIEDEDSNRVMSFTYGPDLQRWSTTMSKNGQIERRTVYMGNYESITEGGVIREFYYLDGGVIIIKQDGEFKPYLAFTDNLGSILSVVDENGEKVFDASYDAWGYQTVTLNEIGLHRGYTGHEMLNEFGIINMNGRLYDPVLGRFFSPDNYVQMPDNSQNFNRYSYCLNNPLKYTDPSGELFGIDDLVLLGVAYSAYTNAMMAIGNGQNAWKAAGLSLLSSAASFGIGQAFGAVGNVGKELLRAGAHGLSSGVINVLGGGDFVSGFASGAIASGIGSLCQGTSMNQVLKVLISAAAGGGAAWVTGGDFLQGALNGMNIAILNHGMHEGNCSITYKHDYAGNIYGDIPEVVCTPKGTSVCSGIFAAASGINSFLDCTGKSLKKNGGNSTIGSNGKFYFHAKGTRGFYGNQYMKTMKLTTIGKGITKVTGPVGKVLNVGNIGVGIYNDYATYQNTGNTNFYNTTRATADVVGGWAGVAIGIKLGSVIGGCFGGFGAIPGAIIGGAVGGIAGSIGGSWMGTSSVDLMYGY